MYTGMHLDVSQESYFLNSNLFFDLKSVLWQMLNCFYSETYAIYLWVSIISARKCYVLVVTCALVICLICIPSALRPAALTGALGMHIRQIPRVHVTTITCSTMPPSLLCLVFHTKTYIPRYPQYISRHLENMYFT